MNTQAKPVLLRRLSAFTTDPRGGNPAGVWIGAALPAAAEMQRIAAEVGFSETAFLARSGGTTYETRYYSPEAEVSFCGHATIASGVLLGEVEREGTYRLATTVGIVPVDVERRGDHIIASLTSVATEHRPVDTHLMAEALGSLGWTHDALTSAIPPVVAYAGAWHLVLALAERATLDALAYDFDRLKSAMLEAGLTTVQVIWRESESVFHSRNPFPVGGVVEDPATGAAAAALGGLLRRHGLLPEDGRFTVHQGDDLGRPSRLYVDATGHGGVRVTGTAVPITA